MRTNLFLLLLINAFVISACCGAPKEKNYIISKKEAQEEKTLPSIKEQ